jgi:O-antigen/teichoic acid export membrane protein
MKIKELSENLKKQVRFRRIQYISLSIFYLGWTFAFLYVDDLWAALSFLFLSIVNLVALCMSEWKREEKFKKLDDIVDKYKDS